MRTNSVIIASNAGFVADVLREKLRDTNLKVYSASTAGELTDKMNVIYPRCLFIENCFHGQSTDVFVQRLVKHDCVVKITVWTVSEVTPLAAARFISAGAESFFSLRDTENNIETIINKIIGGRHYYPAEVQAVLDRNDYSPVIGKSLSQREIEVFKLTIDCYENVQIGEILSISLGTVKHHKKSIYRKCGGNKPLDILRNGIIKGIITPEDLV